MVYAVSLFILIAAVSGTLCFMAGYNKGFSKGKEQTASEITAFNQGVLVDKISKSYLKSKSH